MKRLAIAILATIGLLVPSTTGRTLAAESASLCGRDTTQVLQGQQLLGRQANEHPGPTAGVTRQGTATHRRRHVSDPDALQPTRRAQ